MKMLLISFFCILLIIGIWCAFYYVSIESIVPRLTDDLCEITTLINDNQWNEAQVVITSSINDWNNTEKLWVYCVHQDDIDEIKARFLIIDKYIKTKSKPLALAEIEYLKVYLKKIQGNESLSLDNVF